MEASTNKEEILGNLSEDHFEVLGSLEDIKKDS
jgi:hypothetical protein